MTGAEGRRGVETKKMNVWLGEAQDQEAGEMRIASLRKISKNLQRRLITSISSPIPK